jgi:hypothetical protein
MWITSSSSVRMPKKYGTDAYNAWGCKSQHLSLIAHLAVGGQTQGEEY